jgi:hypothetical protein
MRWCVAWLAAGVLMVAACGETVVKQEEAAPNPLVVKGKAKVVSVDNTLGLAVLEYEGKRVRSYWQTETVLAQRGTVRADDPVKAPVGEYREPVVRAEVFGATPGDTIDFVGMWTGKDILLRGVAVVK